MIVVAESRRFVMTEPDDFTRFHVDATQLTADEFSALLERSRVVRAHDQTDHVWVSTAFIVDELDVESHASRCQGLEAMLAYAAARGWLDESGSSIAAHVEVARS